MIRLIRLIRLSRIVRFIRVIQVVRLLGLLESTFAATSIPLPGAQEGVLCEFPQLRVCCVRACASWIVRTCTTWVRCVRSGACVF